MSGEGFVFSLADAAKDENASTEKKELTQEEKEAKRNSLLEMSLDDLTNEKRAERRKEIQEKREKRREAGEEPPRHHRKDRDSRNKRYEVEKPKIVNLNLTERQIMRIAETSDIDTDKYDITLRLVMHKKHGGR